jgi:hypothetical protein
MFKQNKPNISSKRLVNRDKAKPSVPGPITTNLFSALNDMKGIQEKLGVIEDNSAKITEILNKLSVYEQAIDLQNKITEEHGKAIDEQNIRIEEQSKNIREIKNTLFPILGMFSTFSCHKEDFNGWFLCDGRILSNKYWNIITQAKYDKIWTINYGEKKLPDLRQQKLSSENWFIYIGVI